MTVPAPAAARDVTGGVPRRPGRARRAPAAAAPLLVAVAVQSIANLGYHAILGRSLTADDYGALGAVLAAMTLVAVPLTALQTAAARTTAAHGLSASTARRGLSRTVATFGVIALPLLAVAPAIREYLALPGTIDAALLAPTLVVAAALATARGLLLGVGATRAVAASYLVSTAVRLATGVPLASGLGVTGALVGTVLGEAAALAVLVLVLRPGRQGAASAVRPRDLAWTALVVSGLFALSTADLFLARHHLPGTVSGAYVAAATIGKTVLALPAAAVSVAYPRLVAAWSGHAQEHRAALRSAVLLVGLPAVLGAAVVALLPGLVLTVLYGPGAFSEAARVVQVLALVAGATALVSTFAHAALARGSAVALLPWLGAILEVLLISTWHASALVVAAGSAAAVAGTVTALAVSELRAWSARPGWPRRAAGSAPVLPSA